MRFWQAALLLASVPAGVAAAGVIGHMIPAEPITEARIAQLPKGEQAAWTAYLARSRALKAEDMASLSRERAGGVAPDAPPTGPSGGAGMPLANPAEWYAGPEARKVADNIVSFQTPAGGWGKNVDRSGPPRLRGQHYVPIEHLPANARSDIPGDEDWAYVGTIDNNATTTEIRFLARVQAALPGAEGEPYRAAMAKGVRYLLTAQFPNGGWPQIYPLQGGYHDAITYNDDAMSDVIAVLTSVAGRAGDFAAIPAPLAAQAGTSVDKAIALILTTQVVIDGKRTVWGQQHDALTLKPVGARNFEPASLSSYESADILAMLMRRPNPSPQLVAAVRAGIDWLQAHAIRDMEWKRGPNGAMLSPKPGAGPIWSRYYDFTTGKPVFGDRDKTIHDDPNELSLERRNGYSWFSNGPQKAIDQYAKWPWRRK
ncbi:pectate lyase [Sphingomonas sp. LB-2]|uniref:pectate lyase n=1 Tax=Sphingomonas caeni TaxID=2984949 RepID=UPI002232BB02|nr:pectate lyase [Sphingomonas caeni]MCW3847391.1 pectate lyase [Sphingomonas caeni]